VELFLKYLWFIFGAFVVLNLISIPMRAKKIARVPEDEKQIRTFLFRFTSFFAAPYFILGFIQLAAGFPNAFYFFFEPLDNFFALLAIMVYLAWTGILAYWVFLKDGAKTLIQYRLVSGIGANNESFIKLSFLVLFLCVTPAMIIMRFVLPSYPYANLFR
jgi:hypothetical protein